MKWFWNKKELEEDSKGSWINRDKKWISLIYINKSLLFLWRNLEEYHNNSHIPLSFLFPTLSGEKTLTHVGAPTPNNCQTLLLSTLPCNPIADSVFGSSNQIKIVSFFKIQCYCSPASTGFPPIFSYSSSALLDYSIPNSLFPFFFIIVGWWDFLEFSRLARVIVRRPFLPPVWSFLGSDFCMRRWFLCPGCCGCCCIWWICRSWNSSRRDCLVTRNWDLESVSLVFGVIKLDQRCFICWFCGKLHFVLHNLMVGLANRRVRI